MTEAFICALEDQFPFLQEVTMCTDNAGCYHKKELVFGLALLNMMVGRQIRIKAVMHTETQDGKGST